MISTKFYKKHLIRAVNTMSLTLKPEYMFDWLLFVESISQFLKPDLRFMSAIYKKSINAEVI